MRPGRYTLVTSPQVCPHRHWVFQESDCYRCYHWSNRGRVRPECESYVAFPSHCPLDVVE